LHSGGAERGELAGGSRNACSDGLEGRIPRVSSAQIGGMLKIIVLCVELLIWIAQAQPTADVTR
jgi:hypothetical protein